MRDAPLRKLVDPPRHFGGLAPGGGTRIASAPPSLFRRWFSIICYTFGIICFVTGGARFAAAIADFREP